MAFVIENLRLAELAIVAERNRPAFEDFCTYLGEAGFSSLHEFATSTDAVRAESAILQYFERPLPDGISLYDGIARPYPDDKGKWLLLGWIFRDAPEQRLRPMIGGMPGATARVKRAALLNAIRAHVGALFPEHERWEWTTICEVVIDRLEGSRRAIKGTLFEAIVRQCLQRLFAQAELPLNVGEAEIRLEGETFDVDVSGASGRLLIPVKTRETMGGGHAGLFTRDIHKSINAAQNAGFDCLPIIIAESWSSDLAALPCSDFVYLNVNPNQIIEVKPLLYVELERRIALFSKLM